MHETNFPVPFSHSVPAPSLYLLSYGPGPASHLWRACQFRARKRTGTAVLLAGLTILSAVGAAVFSSCTFCYAVTSGGMPVAYVQKEEAYDKAVAGVESRVSRILQAEYNYTQDTQVALTIAHKDELTNSDALASQLMETVEQVQTQYVLTVDGVQAGVCSDPKDIEQALRLAQARYHTGDTVSSSIESQVSICQDYLPAQTQPLTAQALSQALTQPTGDDAAGPPLLKVRTVEEISYIQSIPAPTEEQPDPSRLEGERETIQEGKPGSELIRESVVRQCGTEQSREILVQDMLEEPAPAIISVGTAPLGPDTIQGRLHWPCQGTITSPFGPREIFGAEDFHRGLDIAVPQGTAITAAEDGVVCWSGPKNSYGNLVQVDHRNGFVTYYGHCEEILVREGQTVRRGEPIAKVGSTGRSTGPHCHFEVRWQEEPIDPRPCLP